MAQNSSISDSIKHETIDLSMSDIFMYIDAINAVVICIVTYMIYQHGDNDNNDDDYNDNEGNNVKSVYTSLVK